MFKDNPSKYHMPHFDLPSTGKYSDSEHTCGIQRASNRNNIESNILEQHTSLLHNLPFKADYSIFRRATTGCPTSKMILPIGLAADCSYIRYHGGQAAALAQIISNINQASIVFENSFNIQLGVTKVVMAELCYPTDSSYKWNKGCSDDYTISERLSDFSQWRSTQIDNNGVWQLASNCPTGSAVGIAWTGSLCQSRATFDGKGAVVSGTSVITSTPVEWKVSAHELGHVFGSEHDCMSSTCPCKNVDNACNCIACGPNCDCRGQYSI
jgi:hypothetical protein